MADTKATTFTGLELDRIPDEANKIFEAHVSGKSPYEKIPASAGKQMEGKTDIKFHYARERLDQMFGPHGVGWKLVPHPQFGQINITADGSAFLVEYRGWVFWFLVVSGDGSYWVDSSVMSDAHKSYGDLGYGHRGAFTSLMKQALRMLGGTDHIYDGYVDGQGDSMDEPPPAKEKAAPKSKPANPAKSKTGLDKIEDSTPIGSAKWDWLPKEHVKKFLEKYQGKTFGDLTDTTRKWLVNDVKAIPFEVAEYLN